MLFDRWPQQYIAVLFFQTQISSEACDTPSQSEVNAGTVTAKCNRIRLALLAVEWMCMTTVIYGIGS